MVYFLFSGILGFEPFITTRAMTAAAQSGGHIIHMNQFAGQLSRSGPQVFFQKDMVEGQKLAQALQQTFNAHTGNQHEPIYGDYYICREMPCPSVIVECGFFSNAQDLANLKTESYRNTLCKLIFSGVMNYLCTE